MSLMMTLPAEDFIPTRYSLLSRLQNWDDQESWKDFFDTYWRLIYSIARKSGLTDAEAQDVVQDTIICVAKNINQFKRDRALGSFKGWLRNLTRWRIADQFRKRAKEAPPFSAAADEISGTSAGTEITGDADTGLDQMWEEEWQSRLAEAAMERVRRRVREEHYQMFDLNVVQQLPAGRVAKILGVSVAAVYLAKHRILRLIKQEVRTLEKEH